LVPQALPGTLGPMLSRRFPRLCILGAAVLFSTGGAAIKLCTLTSWQVTSFRSGLAAVALLVFLPASRRRWGWRSVLVGSTYAATLILFVRANKLATASDAIFLQSAAPLYILLVSPWLLREPIRRMDLFYMALLALGLALVFLGDDRHRVSAPDPFQGKLLATLSGVCWAATILGLRWLGKRPDGDAATAASVVSGNLLACLVTLPLAVPAQVGLFDWLVLTYLGLFQVGWAWILQGEEPAAGSIAGAVLIIAALLLKARHDSSSIKSPVSSPPPSEKILP
jgi:drug/metabolite transporter, DME family